MTTIMQQIEKVQQDNRVLTRLAVLRIVVGTLAGGCLVILLAI